MSTNSIITSQPGPQSAFLATQADVAIFGGAAGGGKSYDLLLEPLRHIHNPLFKALLLRRNMTTITKPGGLWDTSMQIYPYVGGRPIPSRNKWVFPSGASIHFGHIEYDSTLLDYQSTQVDYIGFDELTEFTRKMFFFMFMRNRSVSGVTPYIRATCNPDPDSFVYDMIKWYLDENLEYPFHGRSGILRYFVHVNDEIFWADNPKTLKLKFGEQARPKSFTFIPSSVEDNKILLNVNPDYIANLQALSYVDRMRYLKGNWRIRYTAGNVFMTDWWEIINASPVQPVETVRFWDFAGTVESQKNPDPDWTVGTKMHKYANGTFVISDVYRTRATPMQVDNAMKNIASQDGVNCKIRFWKDPGQAGKYQDSTMIRKFAGYDIKSLPAINDKLTNAKPLAAQVEAGNVKLLKADWNQEFIMEHTNFNPDGRQSGHDDQVDSASGAFKSLTSDKVIFVGVA